MLEALSNNPGLMVLLLLAGTALVGGASLWRLRLEWRAFAEWRAAGMPAPGPAASPAGQPAAAWSSDLDATPLAGAGGALKSPPSDLRAIVDYIRTRRGGAPYSIPLGWCRDAAGEADLITAQLVGDVNHILITGQTDAGKDNAVAGMLLALARQHGPQAVQFAIIDGKGLGWQKWANKAHTWRLALDPEEIAPAMAALVAERQRRKAIIAATGEAEKWDEYQGGDLPLLVVFVSELLLLENAVGAKALTAWLNTELTAARAFGIRYILATQTASNFDTQWRSQIGLFLAGFQPTSTQDKPNTGLTSAELAELGAIAPSQLPPAPGGAGVFTAVQGRDVATVRASLLTSQHRAWVLSSLPDRPAERGQNHGKTTAENSRPATPAGDQAVLLQLLQTGQALPIEPAPGSGAGSTPVAAATRQQEAQNAAGGSAVAVGSGSTFLSVSDQPAAPVVAVDLVPADEQARILAAAQQATSRRQVGLKLYEATGGQKYRWVQMVCDAAGLLMPAGGAQ